LQGPVTLLPSTPCLSVLSGSQRTSNLMALLDER
jgi:hypothetical protein